MLNRQFLGSGKLRQPGRLPTSCRPLLSKLGPDEVRIADGEFEDEVFDDVGCCDVVWSHGAGADGAYNPVEFFVAQVLRSARSKLMLSVIRWSRSRFLLVVG